LKIRQKIALWITGAGVFVSLVFSIIVFLEMKEQPYQLIDDELNTVAQDVMRIAHPAGENPEAMQSKNALINSKEYWIKIYNDRMAIVYQSELTRYADLPLYDKHSGYTIRTTIPKERLKLHQDKKNEVIFESEEFGYR